MDDFLDLDPRHSSQLRHLHAVGSPDALLVGAANGDFGRGGRFPDAHDLVRSVQAALDTPLPAVVV